MEAVNYDRLLLLVVRAEKRHERLVADVVPVQFTSGTRLRRSLNVCSPQTVSRIERFFVGSEMLLATI